MKWYKVSEQLPTKDGDYLTVLCYATNLYKIEIRSFAKNGSKIDDWDLRNQVNIFYVYDSEYGYCSTNRVIYWGELPPLPNEFTKEKK